MIAARPWLVLYALACPVALGATDAPQPGAVEIARSSLLTVNGVAEPAGLRVWVRRTAGQAPLVVTEFATTIDGTSRPATRSPLGGWTVPLGTTSAGEHRLAVTIGHDGIREVLEGKFTAGSAAAPAAAGSRANHKQMLWWVLNIAIVLVAAIAISRRMS